MSMLLLPTSGKPVPKHLSGSSKDLSTKISGSMSMSTTGTSDPMIKRQVINIGDHVIENDPEYPVPDPYSGEVVSIAQNGDPGDYNYVATIALDKKSRKIRRIKGIAKDGYITAMGADIDLIPDTNPTRSKVF